MGEMVPREDAGRLVLDCFSVVPPHTNEGEPFGVVEYAPPYAEPAEFAELRAELLTLALNRPLLTRRDEARYVIDSIRGQGATIRMDSQSGASEIDRPRLLPYALLVRYIELREFVEDELTREASAACEDRRAAFEAHAKRFGAAVARREFGIPETDTNEGADDGTAGERLREAVSPLQESEV